MSEGIIYIPVDEAEVDRIAKARTAVHAGQTSGQFFGNADEVQHRGVAGEMAFAIWSGLPMDREAKRGGDGGKDFAIQLGGQWTSIDVKTARKPFNLLVKQKDAQRCADILVLAGYEPGMVALWGWETRDMMLRADVREFGSGVPNFFRPRDELRPMWQLMNQLARRAA